MDWFSTARPGAYGRVYFNGQSAMNRTGLESVVEILDGSGSLAVCFHREQDGSLALRVPVHTVAVAGRKLKVPAVEGAAATELLRKAMVLRKTALREAGQPHPAGDIYEVRRVGKALRAVRVTTAAAGAA